MMSVAKSRRKLIVTLLADAQNLDLFSIGLKALRYARFVIRTIDVLKPPQRPRSDVHTNEKVNIVLAGPDHQREALS